MLNIETLQLLYAACEAHRRDSMGAYTVGAFTRVAFVHSRDGIKLIRDDRPDTSGVAVYALSSHW